MAIHKSDKIESTQGFTKEIDAGSMHMALDVLQRFQYQFPQKSTIRELAANAVDSIKERDIAKLIISGRAKEEDYYIRRDDPEFIDSNFNISYFDPKWLSSKKDVEIIYEEGDGIKSKDRLRVIDEGVGLGGRRLELYFKLNASTKRNSKSAIGKWGLGAKAGLSTGVDSYRVITRHNGRQFTFDVYSHKVDSVTEKFNELGDLNPSYTFENGYTCYYENTNLLNGTEIIIEAKKHHRSLYTDAVRSQLLYMDGVRYKVKYEAGYEQELASKANVIYQDDDIILSDNNQYSKPHIVINNVCYGPINFLELEEQDRSGNIGIKMDAEDIDISPSRESVIWGDKTRAAVTKKFEKVQEIASNEVEKQLQEKDFGQWLVKCSNVLATGSSSNDILGRLSRVIDRHNLKPSYSENTDIKFKSVKEMLYGVSIRYIKVESQYNYRTGKTKTSINREDLATWSHMSTGLYYSENIANNMKDRYILSKGYGFTLLQIPEVVDEETFKKRYENDSAVKSGKVNPDVEWLAYQTKFKNTMDIIDLLKQSKLANNYDTIEVPEEFIKKINEAEKSEDGVVAVEKDEVVVPELTPAERRKLDERVVLCYPQFSNYAQTQTKTTTDANGVKTSTTVNSMFNWIKNEPKISEVLEWKGNVIYCYGDEDDKLLTTAWLLFGQATNLYPNFTIPQPLAYFNDSIRLVRVAKGLKKYMKDFIHVDEFYKEKGKNGELVMSELFVKWYTGKLIQEGLDSVKFLSNFSGFNQDIFDKYNELRTYQTKNYIKLDDQRNYYSQNLLGCSKDAFDAISTYAAKATALQLFVVNNPDDDIKEKAKLILGEEFTGATGVDLEVYNKLQEVIEYAKPLTSILSYIPLLSDPKASIPYELESEIKTIMSNKGYDN